MTDLSQYNEIEQTYIIAKAAYFAAIALIPEDADRFERREWRKRLGITELANAFYKAEDALVEYALKRLEDYNEDGKKTADGWRELLISHKGAKARRKLIELCLS